MYLSINPISSLVQTLFGKDSLPLSKNIQGLNQPPTQETASPPPSSEPDNHELKAASKIDLKV